MTRYGLIAVAILAFITAIDRAWADAPADTLSDETLKAYEARPFDQREMMGKHEVLGVHHGAQVIADFPCSDVCPNYTKRIIHYALPADKRCRDIGGEERAIMVPRGIAVARENFCMPGIIGKQ